MTPERFQQLAAEGYTRIPLVREVLADLDTPVSAYLKLADRPCSFLFESVQGGRNGGVIPSSACLVGPLYRFGIGKSGSLSTALRLSITK